MFTGVKIHFVVYKCKGVHCVYRCEVFTLLCASVKVFIVFTGVKIHFVVYKCKGVHCVYRCEDSLCCVQV